MPKVEPTGRICGQCGAGFLVGGRGRGRLRQRFCSGRCAALARQHRATALKLARLDAAYFAGLLDGEGSIFVASQREARKTWRMSISNTNRPILEWCQQVTGVGSIITSPRRSEKHSQAWWWQCYSWNAVAVARQLLPFLKIKRDRALQMIAEYDAVATRGKPPKE